MGRRPRKPNLHSPQPVADHFDLPSSSYRKSKECAAVRTGQPNSFCRRTTAICADTGHRALVRISLPGDPPSDRLPVGNSSFSGSGPSGHPSGRHHLLPIVSCHLGHFLRRCTMGISLSASSGGFAFRHDRCIDNYDWLALLQRRVRRHSRRRLFRLQSQRPTRIKSHLAVSAQRLRSSDE